MFSKFATKIWKTPEDVSEEMQPISNAASTTRRPRPSPYTRITTTDNDPLGNNGKRRYTVRIGHRLSALPNS